MDGTSFIVGNEGGVYPMLTDQYGNGLIVVGASASAVKGYAVGCQLISNVSGDVKLYINTGTTTTATWTVVGSQS